MNLTEATMKALQGTLNDDIDYTTIEVYIDVNKSSLDGKHYFKNKQELQQYFSKAFKPDIVDLLLTFDNNEYTEIIEPRNDDNCSRSCKFEFPDSRYPNKKLYISIKGFYNRPAPEPNKLLTQQEALDQVMNELEIVYSTEKFGDAIIVKGEIGGDLITYQIDKNGFIGVK